MSEPLPTRQQILEMMNGFRPAFVIGAAAELDLWTALGNQSLTAAQLAEKLHCNARAMPMILDALAALQLLNKEHGRYNVSPEQKNWLVEGGHETILPMLRHAMNIARSWSQLAWGVKAGVPLPRPNSIRGPIADRESFIAAMHSIAGPRADDLVAQLGPLSFRHLLDVGGASGTWTLAFLRAVPDATATIFDLPDAIQQARDRLASTEFADRVTLVAGDFYTDDLPDEADFAWVSAICHQHSRRHNRDLFVKVWRALVPGGRIAIRDIVMAPSRTEPLDGALFAINMLVNTDSGGTFTYEEFAEDLKASGFQHPRLLIEHAGMDSVVEASRP